MQSPLNASASSIGSLFSNSKFEIPRFQRDYSWQEDEVREFWDDLKDHIDSDTYFLGLIILTDEGSRKQVVDGQQRIVTLSLLASALYSEALVLKRKALADRIHSEFLMSIDYETDATKPRVKLSHDADNTTFLSIINNEEVENIKDDSVSGRLITSYRYLQKKLREDLQEDPFKRIGKWVEFLRDKVHCAIFVHPDADAAYQVFEVINTRGRDLTTADLLKNYILSNTKPEESERQYRRWQQLSTSFSSAGTSSTFVQFIRHVVTIHSGHILPKDLYGYLAGRSKSPAKDPPDTDELIGLLEKYLPLYRQMIDPSLSGPASVFAQGVFAALNSLNVMTVRPILLALSDLDNADEGMNYVLKLVVRRIIVGSLGTGNVERRFGEMARSISDTNSLNNIAIELADLMPDKDFFVSQLRKRSYNKGTLTFIRRSIIEKCITPKNGGTLHFIRPKSAKWLGMTDEEAVYRATSIGNTFLSNDKRRPSEASENWELFRESMFPVAVDGEICDYLKEHEEWNAGAIDDTSAKLAKKAGEFWYD